MRGTALAVAIAAMLLVWSVAARPAAESGTQSTITLEAENIDLREFVERLGEAGQLAMKVRPDIADQKVSVSFRGAALDEAKKAVAALFGYSWTRERIGDQEYHVLFRDGRSRLLQQQAMDAYRNAVKREHQAMMGGLLDGSYAERRRQRDPDSYPQAAGLIATYHDAAAVALMLNETEWNRLAAGLDVPLPLERLSDEGREAMERLTRGKALFRDQPASAVVRMLRVGGADTEMELMLSTPRGAQAYNWTLEKRAVANVQQALGALRRLELPSAWVGQKVAGRQEKRVAGGFRWQQPTGRLREAVLQLGDALKVSILADCHAGRPIPLPEVAGKPASAAIAQVAAAFDHDWAVTSSGIFLLRHRNWCAEDAVQVPNRLLARWAEAGKRDSALGLEVLAEMAHLTDSQLRTLALEMPGANLSGLPWPVLRLYVGLSESERAAARTDFLSLRALPAAKTAALREAMPVTSAQQYSDYDRVLKLRQLADASLKLEETPGKGIRFLFKDARPPHRIETFHVPRLPFKVDSL